MKKDLPSLTHTRMLLPSSSEPKKLDPLANAVIESSSRAFRNCNSSTGPHFWSRHPPTLGPCFVPGVASLIHSMPLGSGFHLHAQLIPTIERENIDFQDHYLGRWNRNLMLMVLEFYP